MVSTAPSDDEEKQTPEGASSSEVEEPDEGVDEGIEADDSGFIVNTSEDEGGRTEVVDYLPSRPLCPKNVLSTH